MSDAGGPSEIEQLETDIEALKQQLEDVKSAENCSSAMEKIIKAVNEREASDGFLMSDEGEKNPFHNPATDQGGGAGCCSLS
mmetsp:Transcript_17650/g.24315  ORF Transcript_17650/g.24315 Transcript_17650/m.24315 type:complete len:82 (+) Transcript_17650:43-288(+)|eukprot:CAMPEP_0185724992 /NCGR_PEP_ID=MMETSP1171-20130828/1331_1 /TAXON_ID=374046 /ORGANISM="Helicotheca tamensis, Strain CCMP826" /LENGTH=81 /DNA_ID=CAMNT_0028392979 /DNA_START=42 /DNA_END=290 /DNA_ORIENTATION=-